jgi:hypothetical protein
MARWGERTALSLAVGLGLSLLGGACAPGPPIASSSPAAGLECETAGYPCSIADVPVEILERSDALGDEVRAMYERSADDAAVRAFLEGQDGMAEVDVDDSATRFRLDGGRGLWILRRAALTRSAPASPASPAFGREPVLDAASPYYIAGGNLERRRALVLSPMRWDFGATDDGEAVAGILAATRGYEDGVTFLANDAPDGSAVGVKSFMGWGAFQVIHVVTHGVRICKTKAGAAIPCRAAIAAGTIEGELKSTDPGVKVFTMDLVKGTLKERGLEIAKAEGTTVDMVFLVADFFRSAYPSGLDATLAFFNACEVLGPEATDLADAVRGTTSVLLGWDGAVDSGAAHATAVALYQDLSEVGHQAELAYSDLGDLQLDPAGTRLVIRPRVAGGDLRIRDIVWLRQPGSGAPLAADAEVAIAGVPGDGEPDAVPFLVQVDGIAEKDAARTVLHVSVDGVEAAPQPVANGQRNDLDQWRVSGQVPLGFDLEGEKTVPIRAWVELPSGGESDHETPARLVGRGSSWGVEARWTYTNHVIGEVAAVGAADLVLRQVPDPTLPKGQTRYEVTGGSWTWSMSGGPTVENCMYSSDTVTVDVGRDRGSAEGSFLIVDTATTPMTYWGILTTIGPDATVTTSGCHPNDFYNGSYARHTRVGWLVIDQDERQSVADGPLMTGSDTQTTDEFTQERSWTIKPLE